MRYDADVAPQFIALIATSVAKSWVKWLHHLRLRAAHLTSFGEFSRPEQNLKYGRG